AVDRGKAVETSMGFTPLEGLIMGTRCGDIDTAAVFYIMKKEKLSINKTDKILNKQSGLLGISEVSNDLRLIKKEAEKGNKKAELSLDMFIHRIKKYIGAYLLILGGANAVCFTGGIGENNPGIINIFRKDIRRLLGGKTKVMVIPTDEEFMIASLTHGLVSSPRPRRKS
ncbi:MAG: acetate kinase, partial [Candidatus Omnitrophica bacterium]|nr:acetate kinase [Candidatus Omnitrophota bacterium]MBD3268655.1 acetate kinase [Candidatus Omnitrophota bacterium]